jgi:hypothetical protein
VVRLQVCAGPRRARPERQRSAGGTVQGGIENRGAGCRCSCARGDTRCCRGRSCRTEGARCSSARGDGEAGSDMCRE